MNDRKRDLAPEVELDGALLLKKNRQKFLEQRRIGLLERIGELGSISGAAKAVGMSYKAAWDAVNSMNNLADQPLTINAAGGKAGGGTVLTEEGERLIRVFRLVEGQHHKSLLSLQRSAEDFDRLFALLRRVSMRISAKTVLFGTVADIRREGLLTEVCLELKSGHRIFSVITSESVDSLGLTVGEGAYAVIKASSVMIARDAEGLPISARNRIGGTVIRHRADAVMGEVVLDIGGGETIAATVTVGSVRELELSDGGRACAVIQAENVIIGVE